MLLNFPVLPVAAVVVRCLSRRKVLQGFLQDSYARAYKIVSVMRDYDQKNNQNVQNKSEMDIQ